MNHSQHTLSREEVLALQYEVCYQGEYGIKYGKCALTGANGLIPVYPIDKHFDRVADSFAITCNDPTVRVFIPIHRIYSFTEIKQP